MARNGLMMSGATLPARIYGHSRNVLVTYLRLEKDTQRQLLVT
jgi:hypothetical protein